MNPSYVFNNSQDYLSPATLNQEQTNWTIEENKLFENAIAEFDHNSPDFFEKIASRVPGKTIKQIENHFQILIEDIEMIESGLIPLPDYESSNERAGSNPTTENKSNQHRRRGVAWSTEEHKMFLEGLKKYGKGDWRSISRHCVVTRSPSQVASHAQKYFLRLRSSAAEQGNSLASKHKENSTTITKDASMAMASSPQLFVSASTSKDTNMVVDGTPFPPLTFLNGASITNEKFDVFAPYLHRKG